MVAAETVERFRADLERLTDGPPGKIGVAVSGGPDSLALLLLAATAYPEAAEAATVDHGLRPESASEAAFVARICGDLSVPHAILPVQWPEPLGSSVQAQARERRYEALASWAASRQLRWVATGHHQDDQAETVLMRLARGAGIDGLSGIRVKRPLAGSTWIIRPLLDWSRAGLFQLVSESDLRPIDDPTNHSEDHDRTRFRALLAATDLLPASRIAAAAKNLAEAKQAVTWAVAGAWQTGFFVEGEACRIRAGGMPRELERRMLIAAIDQLRTFNGLPGKWRKDKLDAVMAKGVDEGRATIAGMLLKSEGQQHWLLSPAPPRKS